MRTKTFLGTTKNSKTCFWSFCSWWPYIWIFKLMVGQKLWQTLFKEVNKLYNLKAGELRDRIAPLEFVFSSYTCLRIYFHLLLSLKYLVLSIQANDQIDSQYLIDFHFRYVFQWLPIWSFMNLNNAIRGYSWIFWLATHSKQDWI